MILTYTKDLMKKKRTQDHQILNEKKKKKTSKLLDFL